MQRNGTDGQGTGVRVRGTGGTRFRRARCERMHSEMETGGEAAGQRKKPTHGLHLKPAAY